ncbi:MAG: GNAT family N-acetyltransferase [Microbacterium sp.]
MLIRPATSADAHGIAIVHVRSWQTAYHGLLPQAVLDDLSVADREKGWARIVEDPDAASRTVVAEQDHRILGWASFGRPREQELPDAGELWGLYAHPDAWSTGVGHALIEVVEQELRDAGHRTGYLWVLDGNDRAASFYERHGWVADGATKVEERPQLHLFERRRVKPLR